MSVEDEHRRIVAVAAKYDNHPHPVVPLSPKEKCHGKVDLIRNNNNGSEANNWGSSSSVSRSSGYGSERRKASMAMDINQRFATAPGRSKMERGISKASENEYIISQARNHVESQFQTSPDSPDIGSSNLKFSTQKEVIDTPVYTFTLPDLTIYPEDFRGFLEKDLIELSSLVSLEQSGRLNWWAETGTCQRLWPLATTGDGNCLLHAASLGMWGFHDRLLTLRKALHNFLSCSQSASSLYRRWRLQCHRQNLEFGLRLSEKEWHDEWRSVLRLASSEPRHGSSSAASDSSCVSTMSSSSSASSSNSYSVNDPNGNKATRRWSRLSIVMGDHHQILYESLEEIHVLALAHILRRPIIVVADTVLRDMNGEALAPIPFGGIYLPLEFAPSQCQRSPLLLTYNAGHFSALVSMQSASQHQMLPAVIPLTDSNHELLPIQFAFDPGEDFSWVDKDDSCYDLSLSSKQHLTLLNSYLEMVKVALPARPSDASCRERERRQTQSVSKHFGSIGKKLKKNLGKLAKNGSFRAKTNSNGNGNYASGHNQTFILSALIHTNLPLPYQNEMVENYLEEARQRFEADRELKIKKKVEMQEMEEKRKRQIYLNGGYLDCSTRDCDGKVEPQQKQPFEHDDLYFCSNCLEKKEQKISCHGKSTFYMSHQEVEEDVASEDSPDLAEEMDNFNRDNQVDSSQPHNHSYGSLEHQLSQLTVKLPPSEETLIHTCRSDGCSFFGNLQFDHFCSKCFSGTRATTEAQPKR